MPERYPESQAVGKRVSDAVAAAGYRCSDGDIAAATGLPTETVKQTLWALMKQTGGGLSVDGQGRLIYTFSRSLLSRRLRRQFDPFFTGVTIVSGLFGATLLMFAVFYFFAFYGLSVIYPTIFFVSMIIGKRLSARSGDDRSAGRGLFLVLGRFCWGFEYGTSLMERAGGLVFVLPERLRARGLNRPQRRLLRLAQEKGGWLDRSEVALAEHVSMTEADRLLTGLMLDHDVRPAVSSDGAILFDFRAFLASRTDAGTPDVELKQRPDEPRYKYGDNSSAVNRVILVSNIIALAAMVPVCVIMFPYILGRFGEWTGGAVFSAALFSLVPLGFHLTILWLRWRSLARYTQKRYQWLRYLLLVHARDDGRALTAREFARESGVDDVEAAAALDAAVGDLVGDIDVEAGDGVAYVFPLMRIEMEALAEAAESDGAGLDFVC